ncbi:IQ motif and ubiquitin-like domain-containing protein [Diadema antillarum]|uniref:IQ motif and ubiquitin-like domain-containing protein n=1 Tax=Diadema antillarum TaxID=105358 RepID=UPI003A855975
MADEQEAQKQEVDHAQQTEGQEQPPTQEGEQAVTTQDNQEAGEAAAESKETAPDSTAEQPASEVQEQPQEADAAKDAQEATAAGNEEAKEGAGAEQAGEGDAKDAAQEENKDAGQDEEANGKVDEEPAGEGAPAENQDAGGEEQQPPQAEDQPAADGAAPEAGATEPESAATEQQAGEGEGDKQPEGEAAGAEEVQAEGEQQQDADGAAPDTGDVAMATEETGETHEVDPHAASPQPDPDVTVNATATVKFVLMPSGQVTTMACALGQTMQELREHLASELRMPADKLVFMFDGSNVDSEATLAAIGVGPNGAVQLEISSSDPVNVPLRAPKPKPEYNMPDIITTRIEREDGTFEDVVVEIERTTRRKPFLGGFRHRMSGVEFHNASAQTMGRVRADDGITRFCRDTQTVSAKNRLQQTTLDTSTQMTTIGCYVSNMTDKLVVPGRYETADEYHAKRLEKVIILQSYFRRWQAKNIVVQLKEDLIRRREWERKEEIRKIKEKEERIRREFERRMNPRTKEDFDLLYHALEKWRQEELTTIDEGMTGAQRKAALCHLLDQETQLIAAIGRHKLQADSENKQRSIQSFLDKAAAPRRWKAFDGKYTEMDTAYTIRARELKDIYNSLNMKYLTQDERLDVLLTLKHTVKEHDCKLTQEIIQLIDREADLLMRGVRESNLEGLRKRISTLFLQYVKTPTFNAEAARLLKVPQDPSTLRKNIYFCPSCSSYLPSTEFQLSSNSSNVGRCRRCTKLDNDARTRQDYSHFRYMLKGLRKSEEAMGDGSRIAFLLQEADLRYLVVDIWSSQSALSCWEDLYDLVLVRWDKDEEWSPWNCILLTKDEAKAHAQIDDLEKKAFQLAHFHSKSSAINHSGGEGVAC